MRQTSIDAYNTIRATGALSKKRWDVYDTLYRIGPATAMEISSQSSLHSNLQADSQVRARLFELREMRCAYEVGTRECSITKQTVILWDLTPNLPYKLTKLQRLERQILICRKRLEKLEDAYANLQREVP